MSFSPDSPLPEVEVPRCAGDSPNPVVSWGERDPVTNAVSVAAAWTNRGSVSSCLVPPGSSAMADHAPKTLGLPKRRLFHRASVKPSLSPVEGSPRTTTSPEQKGAARHCAQVASPLQFGFSPERTPEAYDARKPVRPSASAGEFSEAEPPSRASEMMSDRLTADPVAPEPAQRRPASANSVGTVSSPRGLSRRPVTWKESPIVPTSASRRLEELMATGVQRGAAVSPWTCFVEGVHKLIGCSP